MALRIVERMFGRGRKEADSITAATSGKEGSESADRTVISEFGSKQEMITEIQQLQSELLGKYFDSFKKKGRKKEDTQYFPVKEVETDFLALFDQEALENPDFKHIINANMRRTEDEGTILTNPEVLQDVAASLTVLPYEAARIVAYLKWMRENSGRLFDVKSEKIKWDIICTLDKTILRELEGIAGKINAGKRYTTEPGGLERVVQRFGEELSDRSFGNYIRTLDYYKHHTEYKREEEILQSIVQAAHNDRQKSQD